MRKFDQFFGGSPLPEIVIPEPVLQPAEPPVVVTQEEPEVVDLPILPDLIGERPDGYLGEIMADGIERGVMLGDDGHTVYRLDGTVLTVVGDVIELDQLLAML